MHLEGSHILAAPRTAVWNMLLDHEVLARVTPGVSRLEVLGEDSYDAFIDIKMGPVNGSFKGKMSVKEKVAPESFVLVMKVNGKIGNVSAEGRLNLKETGTSATEVAFAGDAKLTGTLARTGQRVISGVARSLTTQFFASIEEELAKAGLIVKPETVVSSAAGLTDSSEGAVRKAGFFIRLKRWFAKIFGK